jgi:hypothetical protein
MRSFAFVAVAGMLLGGCFSPSYPENLPCDVDGWCPPDQMCNAAQICIAVAGGDGDGGAVIGDGGVPFDGAPDALNGMGQLLSITIGDDVTLSIGMTHQFNVTANYEGGSIMVTDEVIWQSNATSVAFVDFTGLTTAAGAGVAEITARYMGRADLAVVTVNP